MPNKSDVNIKQTIINHVYFSKSKLKLDLSLNFLKNRFIVNIVKCFYLKNIFPDIKLQYQICLFVYKQKYTQGSNVRQVFLGTEEFFIVIFCNDVIFKEIFLLVFVFCLNMEI